MIAPSILFDPNPAFWAVPHIFVLCSPIFEASIHHGLAALAPMPGLPTQETEFEAALASDLSLRALLDKVGAVWARAPSEVRVHVDIDVLFELEIFVIEFLRAEEANVLPSVFLGARSIRALDRSHLTIGDVVL